MPLLSQRPSPAYRVRRLRLRISPDVSCVCVSANSGVSDQLAIDLRKSAQFAADGPTLTHNFGRRSFVEPSGQNTTDDSDDFGSCVRGAHGPVSNTAVVTWKLLVLDGVLFVGTHWL